MTNLWQEIKNKFTRIQDLASLGSSTIIAQAILAIFWIYLASLLGDVKYGEVTYFISIANIASVIAFLGAGNVILVYTAKKETQLQGPIISVTITSGLITSLVLFLILQKIEISIFVIGFVLFGLATNELLGIKHYKKYAKYLISQRILNVVLSLGLYFLIGTNGIILGFALSFFPHIIRLVPILKKSKFEFSLLKPKIGFMSNSYILDLTRTFSFYIDKLIIFPLFGFAVLGNYQLGIQFLTVLSILPNIVFQYILPHDAGGQSTFKLKLITILVSFALSIVSVLLIPYALPIIFPDFTQSIVIIQILSIAIIPRTISMMYMSKFLASEKSKIIVFGSAIYIVTQILGITILGKIYLIEGVAWALVIAAVFEAVFLIIISKLGYK
jgi:O-antigen/teichoic acid export membrane protein